MDTVKIIEHVHGHGPERAHSGDAGLDLRATVSTQLAPNGRRAIGTGVTVSVPDGYVGLVCPRSGLALNDGVTVANSPGIVDSGYRGEIKVILHNTLASSYTVGQGDKIAQLVIVPVCLAATEVVDHLDETARGGSGFGSTGR